jgi:hypothetical protein
MFSKAVRVREASAVPFSREREGQEVLWIWYTCGSSLPSAVKQLDIVYASALLSLKASGSQ